MKIHRLLCLTAVLASSARGVESSTPAALPADRYATMAGQSPFAIASAPPTPPPPPEASFAANWYVTGLARLGDTDFVTIKSQDATLLFSLFGQEPGKDGVSVASVNWSDTLGKSTVILKKGTETAKLEFNEQAMRGPSSAPPPAPAPPPAGVAGAPPARPGAHPPILPPNAVHPQFPPGAPKPIVRRRLQPIPAPK